jgi:hypothetical protein
MHIYWWEIAWVSVTIISYILLRWMNYLEGKVWVRRDFVMCLWVCPLIFWGVIPVAIDVIIKHAKQAKLKRNAGKPNRWKEWWDKPSRI